MATSAPGLQTSLVPIFIARLRLLKAIVPGLHELPRPCLDEVLALLEQTERLVEESVGRSVSSEPESAPEP
jgi:hypothetical protein